jgi:hypothetical protein
VTYSYLVYDTETTGFAREGSFKDAGQPDCVQLAFRVFNQYDEERMSFAALNRAIDFIPSSAVSVHHKDVDACKLYGLEPDALAWAFLHALARVDFCVCHNAEYDYLVIRRLMWQCGIAPQAKRKHFCTMRTMTDICELPPKKRGTKFKFPTLAEAYFKLFTTMPLVGAHDAFHDVSTTHDVFVAMRRIYPGLVQEELDLAPTEPIYA